MQGIYDFPPPLRAAADAALLPGEHAAWAGRPSPMRAFWRVTPIWLFAAPWSAISFLFFGSAVAALTGAATIEGAEGPMAWVFLIFSLPFVAIGAGLLAAPVFAMRDAMASGFIVTDRRVMKISAQGARTVKALAASALRGAQSRIGADGRGSVKALGPVGRDSDGDKVTDDIEMTGVADARGAEAAIWRLIGERGNNP